MMMNKVYVVFSGEYQLMKVQTRQLEGTLPAFRIEAVFSTVEKCEAWIRRHEKSLSSTVLSFLEIPFDPLSRERESEMQVFHVRMNSELHIIDVKMGDESDLEEGEFFTLTQIEGGGFQGVFFARDLIDACKLAFTRGQELLNGK
ncbi:hypothetical protein PBT90_05715 [Algoriphagus halophytocola]|uniref:IPExxxVDY family protein n=1 Tax=Algoriphagus halophytocola TaxID=2991499 RepID=A0ABY6ML31_9BACT|nr:MULTISPECIES: hypothetical protein [unclassified Algoriphagus]UZD22914.1 hypothetical protein OM944_00165 [Algoriphagus sp. TR-M5]WBL44182.1 hypothetical protein PBT90_05715 [Algoriphagus sp. TR-M9]